MSLAELRTRHDRAWAAIDKADKAADLQIDKIRKLIAGAVGEGSIDSADISVVAFGSLARREWTSGSDFDWTLLVDGQADHRHVQTAQRMASLLQGANVTRPGPTGVFGKLAFSHDLIHQIGGQDDTNQNTTRRMLLFLESRPVNRPDAHDRVVRGIVQRYLENDFRDFRLKVPRFLLNDVHRFWRTMCVDYASKYRERAAEGWAIRNVKLRMSRKLIFAAGLIACYSCAPEWVAGRNPGLRANPTVEGLGRFLEDFAKRTPLEILAEVLLQHPKPETTVTLLDAYDYFLAWLDDADLRDHLKKLQPKDAAIDEKYAAIQENCDRFESALEQLFFDDNPHLAPLTRKYGVF